MIEDVLNSPVKVLKNSSWNYASFNIADPLGFHARPAMWVKDALGTCPGKVEIALLEQDMDPASARYIEIHSIMDLLLYSANSSGRILNIRYDTRSKEIDTALETIREVATMVWPKTIGRRYA